MSAAEPLSNVNVGANIRGDDITFGHAWTDEYGVTHATVRFGSFAFIALSSDAAAEALIAAATRARDERAALKAERAEEGGKQ